MVACQSVKTMETNDIFDGYDDATLRAFFPKYLKQNALEKSFKEQISEEGETSTVVPVNVQSKRRKSSVRGRRRSSFIMKQAPPINTESRVPQ